MTKIFPSLISADLMNLEKEVKRLAPYCEGFHLDVMDNHFVPNLTIGPSMINALGTISPKPLWVHLMISNPASIIDALMLPAGTTVTFHYENNGEKRELIKRIKNKEWQPSMAINPSTPVQDVFSYLDELSQLLIMSVEPGFSGQPMITDTIKKITPLNAYRQTSDLMFRIGIDGGITANNIVELKDKGVQDFAIAAGIFKAPDPINMLKILQQKIA